MPSRGKLSGGLNKAIQMACAGLIATGVALAQGDNPPLQARAVGFSQKTFDSGFSLSKFDITGTYQRGYEWYLWNFFGDTPSSVGLTFNGDNTVTINPGTRNNGQVVSAASLGGDKWVGTAFGGGGYFEVILKFDPTRVNCANGCPSFWSMSIEHLINSDGPQWNGQAPKYSHYIEVDVFEYDVYSEGINTYGAAMREWYGRYNVTCVTGHCNVTTPYSDLVRRAPADIDWRQYHKIGFLWLPATASTSGSATFYLDDQQVGVATTWSQFAAQTPPPGGNAPWTFGIIDMQHLSLMIGTGIGQPMTVRSVKVWQGSSAANLSQ
jgi:hypothetical protein